MGQIWPSDRLHKQCFIGAQPAHLFMYCFYGLSYYKSRLEYLLRRLYGPLNLKYLASGTLQSSLPTRELEQLKHQMGCFDR